MIIKDVKTWVADFNLSKPYKIANQTIDKATNCLLAIYLENGVVGLGAGAPIDFVTGETFAACENALSQKNLEWLVGHSLLAQGAANQYLAKHYKSTPAARAAIDIAWHDALAQCAALPLVDMLGRCHQQLPTSITIGIMNVEETLQQAKEHIANCFKVLKIKLGENLEEDLERLIKLREAYAKEIIIRVDPNQGYSLQEFNEFYHKAQHLNLELIEQPLSVNSIENYRALPESIKQHIALDESLQTVDDAFHLLSPKKSCGIFNIKLMKCGGISVGQQIANLAQTGDVDLMWGCMDESMISISAALHLAFASPKTKYLDLDGSFDILDDYVTGGFVLENGMMRLTDSVGLGVKAIAGGDF